MKQFNVNEIRKDFPILTRRINGKPLVYLDNAATSQKPVPVIRALEEYYTQHNANVHRSLHQLGEEATEQYEEAHRKTAAFIGAVPEEIVFTKSTTESLNLLSYSLAARLQKGDEILITKMEHHSNLIPWQQLAMRAGAKLQYVDVIQDGRLDMNNLNNKITSSTKIVSVTHVSNVLGTINPVKEIGAVAHDHGALFILDAAQSIPHMHVAVQDSGCDFCAFSGHKMLGPTGIGVLYGKREHLEALEPFMFGGEMIQEVTLEGAKWNSVPWKFEAGTPNIAQAVGLGAAVDYLNSKGMETVFAHEKKLTAYALKQFQGLSGVKVYGPAERVGVISFNLNGIHPHDVASILNEDGIAIRAGHHCAMPLHTALGIDASCRASFYLYNTMEEVDALVASLQRAQKLFS